MPAKKRGRPRKAFDLAAVEGLGKIGATYQEMGAVLGCNESTVVDRMKETGDFSKAYKKGQGLRRASLRRKQTDLALAGNVTMLIWLGKNELNQTDRVTEETVDLTKLTRDQLRRLAKGMSLRDVLRQG